MSACSKCGAPMQIGDWPFCPHGAMRSFAEHGDEIDYVDHNLGKDPIRIRSKAERKRIMQERGLVEADWYVEPPPTFEGKPVTQNWAQYRDLRPETLAWIAEAMTRGGHKEPEPPTLPVRTFVETVKP